MQTQIDFFHNLTEIRENASRFGIGCAVRGFLKGLSMTANRDEDYLRANFGDVYDDHAACTPRILPNPALFWMASTARANVAITRPNFFDAVVFVALIPDAESNESIREVAGLFKLWIY